MEVKHVGHKVWDLCRIAEADCNHVVIFVPFKFEDRVRAELGNDAERFEFFSAQEGESLRAYFRRVEAFCRNEVDVVIANTLTSPHFATFRPEAKFLGFVYNVNWWCRDTKSPLIYIQRLFNLWSLLVPSLMYNAWTSVFVRRAITHKLDGLILEYEPLVDLAKKTYGFPRGVYFLPSRVYRGPCSRGSKGKLQFVVPGKIQSFRRDYQSLIDAFALLQPADAAKCRLVLLGRPVGRYGASIIQKLTALTETGLEVDCPDGFVPPESFERKMLESDMIIAPLRLKFAFGTVHETFTHTKASGSFDDAIGFGLPSLVPSFYNVPADMAECFIKYQGPAHLAETVSQYANSPELVKRLRQATTATFRRYSLARFQTDFLHILDDLGIGNSNRKLESS